MKLCGLYLRPRAAVPKERRLELLDIVTRFVKRDFNESVPNTFEVYRRMGGKCVAMRFLLGFEKSDLGPIFAPYGRCLKRGPQSRPLLRPFVREVLDMWRPRLMRHSSASFYWSEVQIPLVYNQPEEYITVYSDACKEDSGLIAMGMYAKWGSDPRSIS